MVKQKQGESSTEMQAQGPGYRLRVARESQNITLEEASKQSRLSTQRLSEIESDDYRSMGATTFARGYLRSYARFLNLPENEILQEFDERNLASNIQSTKPKLIHERIIHGSDHSIRGITYVVVAALAVGVAFWWHSHSNAEKALSQAVPAATSGAASAAGTDAAQAVQTQSNAAATTNSAPADTQSADTRAAPAAAAPDTGASAGAPNATQTQ